jgi:hypothetical protein
MSGSALSVADLEQWRLFGADWRILTIGPRLAVFELCACTGEMVERHESTDQDVIRYLQTREE